MARYAWDKFGTEVRSPDMPFCLLEAFNTANLGVGGGQMPFRLSGEGGCRAD